MIVNLRGILVPFEGDESPTTNVKLNIRILRSYHNDGVPLTILETVVLCQTDSIVLMQLGKLTTKFTCPNFMLPTHRNPFIRQETGIAVKLVIVYRRIENMAHQKSFGPYLATQQTVTQSFTEMHRGKNKSLFLCESPCSSVIISFFCRVLSKAQTRQFLKIL